MPYLCYNRYIVPFERLGNSMADFFERLGTIAMCLVIFLSIIFFIENIQHDPFLTNSEATHVASEYTSKTGRIDIDQLMHDRYGFEPTNREGNVGSWVNGEQQLWLTIDEGKVIDVNCRAGFEWGVYKVEPYNVKDPDYENPIFYIVYKNERCEVSSEALAALFSAALGRYQGFRSV